MNMPLILPLREGDRLTRDEFERRYHAMPGVKKIELIDGVVYMPSPVRYDQHGQQHADFVGWIGYYRAFTRGVGSADNATVRLDLDSEPQPDAVMFLLRNGRVRIEEGYITGGPEVAAEISASSKDFDLTVKLELYRRNGVQEYIVWRVLDDEIDWFILKNEQYEKLSADESGIIRSQVFPGLWLDAPALVRGDLLRVHDVLHQGINSPEHQAFAASLRDTP